MGWSGGVVVWGGVVVGGVGCGGVGCRVEWGVGWQDVWWDGVCVI